MPIKKKKLGKASKAKPKKNPRINSSHELHSKFIRRILTYGVFGVITVILTFLVYFRAKGYTFTRDGEVLRRGIVLVDSKPISSKIILDDKEIDSTEAKLEVNEGVHTIKLQAEGYRTWQRTFNMQAEKVRWFFYPYLIPTKLNQAEYLASQTAKQYSEANIEGRMVAITKTGDGQNQALQLELLNLKEQDTAKQLTILQIPANLFSPLVGGGYGSLSFTEWSPNGDSILVEHFLEDKTEIVNLRIDSPTESLNISNVLGAPITSAHYDERSKLNLLTSGELALYNPKTLLKEQVISSGVASFKSYNDGIYVYSKPDVNNSNIYIQNGQGNPVLVSVISTNDTTQYDYEYLVNRRVGYLAISNQVNKELQVYKSPLDAVALDAKLSPLHLSTFSQLRSVELKSSPRGSRQPGTYVAIQLTGSKILIYDFEEEESFNYDLQSLSKTEQITQQTTELDLDISDLGWIDPQRLQARTVNGNIYYFDYDGNYLNLIGSGAESLSSFVASKNSSFIVSKPNGTGTIITKVNLKNE